MKIFPKIYIPKTEQLSKLFVEEFKKYFPEIHEKLKLDRNQDFLKGSSSENVEKIINCIFSAETEEDFKALPKLGLMFEYQGTSEEYKPAVICFTETYEDSMRKIQSSDYALVVKRVNEETSENDGMISEEAMAAFTFEPEETVKEEVKKDKKGGRK